MSILAKKYEKMMSAGRSDGGGGKRTISMSQDLVENVKREYDRIRDFLSGKHVAAWYRGTSIFHIEGANRLFNAIRDDTEQSTSHRVRNCLLMIGLDPLISRKQIKLLMRLSRGNDLAFLWFLMELHYKTPDPDVYSLNEQLICSAICHLDMIPTLRELDRILPKQSPRKRRKRKVQPELPVWSRRKLLPKCGVTVDKNFPYFQPQPRPVPYGKPLGLKEPNFEVRFDAYKQYKDPNYIAMNETNRWYATYKFQTGKRVVNGILKEEVDNIFEKDSLQLLETTGKTNLCYYHKLLLEIEEKLKHELRVEARNRCLRHFLGGNANKREARQAKLLECLEQEIQREMGTFRRDSNTIRESLAIKAITSDCKVVNFMLGGEACEECKSEPLRDDLRIVNLPDKSKVIVSRRDMEKDRLDGPVIMPSDKPLEPPSNGNNNKNGMDHRRSALSQKKCKGGKDTCNIQILDQGQFFDTNRFKSISLPPPTPQQQQQQPEMEETTTFFRNTGNNQPHFFDYEKIFNFREERDLEEQVKEAIVNELAPEYTDLHLFEKIRISYTDMVRDAVCGMWEEGVCQYNAVEEAKRKKEEPKTRLLNQNLTKYPEGVYYNPNDKELMEQMLKDAFDHIRRSPRFVWAQLPDAHRVPLLKEWIANRYGKQYTREQRNNSFAFSLKIFQALDRIDLSLPIPTTSILGKNPFIDYSCRSYLREKVKGVKDKFNRALNNNILEHSRIFWFAMSGFMCSGGPPFKTFFAYVPSRIADIQRFRLWQPFEFRDYKSAWEKRRTKELSKESY